MNTLCKAIEHHSDGEVHDQGRFKPADLTCPEPYNLVFFIRLRRHRMTFIRIYMPNGGEDGVIIANLNNEKRIEFRGNPYSQWDESESSPMFKIHSMIKRANISNLHADGIETITPWHSEWLDIYQMILDA